MGPLSHLVLALLVATPAAADRGDDLLTKLKALDDPDQLWDLLKKASRDPVKEEPFEDSFDVGSEDIFGSEEDNVSNIDSKEWTSTSLPVSSFDVTSPQIPSSTLPESSTSTELNNLSSNSVPLSTSTTPIPPTTVKQTTKADETPTVTSPPITSSAPTKTTTELNNISNNSVPLSTSTTPMPPTTLKQTTKADETLTVTSPTTSAPTKTTTELTNLSSNSVPLSTSTTPIPHTTFKQTTKADETLTVTSPTTPAPTKTTTELKNLFSNSVPLSTSTTPIPPTTVKQTTKADETPTVTSPTTSVPTKTTTELNNLSNNSVPSSISTTPIPPTTLKQTTEADENPQETSTPPTSTPKDPNKVTTTIKTTTPKPFDDKSDFNITTPIYLTTIPTEITVTSQSTDETTQTVLHFSSTIPTKTEITDASQPTQATTQSELSSMVPTKTTKNTETDNVTSMSMPPTTPTTESDLTLTTPSTTVTTQVTQTPVDSESNLSITTPSKTSLNPQTVTATYPKFSSTTPVTPSEPTNVTVTPKVETSVVPPKLTTTPSLPQVTSDLRRTTTVSPTQIPKKETVTPANMTPEDSDDRTTVQNIITTTEETSPVPSKEDSGLSTTTPVSSTVTSNSKEETFSPKPILTTPDDDSTAPVKASEKTSMTNKPTQVGPKKGSDIPTTTPITPSTVSKSITPPIKTTPNDKAETGARTTDAKSTTLEIKASTTTEDVSTISTTSSPSTSNLTTSTQSTLSVLPTTEFTTTEATVQTPIKESNLSTTTTSEPKLSKTIPPHTVLLSTTTSPPKSSTVVTLSTKTTLKPSPKTSFTTEYSTPGTITQSKQLSKATVPYSPVETTTQLVTHDQKSVTSTESSNITTDKSKKSTMKAETTIPIPTESRQLTTETTVKNISSTVKVKPDENLTSKSTTAKTFTTTSAFKTSTSPYLSTTKTPTTKSRTTDQTTVSSVTDKTTTQKKTTPKTQEKKIPTTTGPIHSTSKKYFTTTITPLTKKTNQSLFTTTSSKKTKPTFAPSTVASTTSRTTSTTGKSSKDSLGKITPTTKAHVKTTTKPSTSRKSTTKLPVTIKKKPVTTATTTLRVTVKESQHPQTVTTIAKPVTLRTTSKPTEAKKLSTPVVTKQKERATTLLPPPPLPRLPPRPTTRPKSWKPVTKPPPVTWTTPLPPPPEPPLPERPTFEEPSGPRLIPSRTFLIPETPPTTTTSKPVHTLSPNKVFAIPDGDPPKKDRPCSACTQSGLPHPGHRTDNSMVQVLAILPPGAHQTNPFNITVKTSNYSPHDPTVYQTPNKLFLNVASVPSTNVKTFNLPPEVRFVLKNVTDHRIPFKTGPPPPPDRIFVRVNPVHSQDRHRLYPIPPRNAPPNILTVPMSVQVRKYDPKATNQNIPEAHFFLQLGESRQHYLPSQNSMTAIPQGSFYQHVRRPRKKRNLEGGSQVSGESGYLNDMRFAEEPKGVSLVFVFDTTGSMSSELEQVRQQASALAEAMTNHPDKPIYEYVFIPFNDPDVGPVNQTSDHFYFQRILDGVKVKGGGDCPEMSMTALLKALQMSTPRSFIYVFTDAGPKDSEHLEQILALIQKKQSMVVFLLTGYCTKEDQTFYEAIASTSNGQVYDLDKTDIDEVLDFIKLNLHSRKVNLVSIDSPVPAKVPKPYPVPVDPTLDEFTISVSGKNPFLKVIDPKGKTATPPQLTEMLNLSNIKVVNIKEPDPGVWTVKVGSDSPHTLRSTALSNTDLKLNYGFSLIPTSNIAETAHRPLAGSQNSLLITSSAPSSLCNLTRVRLLGFDGEVVATIILTEDKHRPGTYMGGPITPPNDFFNIEVQGYDSSGNLLKRIFPSAIAPQIPNMPEVSAKDLVKVPSGKTLVLDCYVESLVPVTVKWAKDGQIRKINSYSQSAKSTLTMLDTSWEAGGNYSCAATNVAGTSVKRIVVIVLEPPKVDVLSEINSEIGDDVILPCCLSSNLPSNVSWLKIPSYNSDNIWNGEIYKEGVTPPGDEYDFDLSLNSVRADQEGWFVCIAMNEGGLSKGLTYLKVVSKPEFESPVYLNFTEGSLLKVTCKLTRPSPLDTLYWSKDGESIKTSYELREGNHENDFQYNLVIPNAKKSDEGTYQCTGSNKHGSAVGYIYVKCLTKPQLKSISNVYVKKGDSANLRCELLEGYPQPKITWLKGNNIVKEEDNFKFFRDSLIISGVREDNGGDYFCNASNTVGTASVHINLQIGSFPVIQQMKTNWIVKYGNAVDIFCKADGKPHPKIIWVKKSGLNYDVIRTEEGVLQIRDATTKDQGLYECTAENYFGKDFTIVNVTVVGLEPPKITIVSSVIKSLVGEKIEIPCNSHGKPKPTITWYKDGNSLDTSFYKNYYINGNGTFVIPVMTSSHTGKYSCLAVNEVGRDKAEFDLRTYEAPNINSNSSSYLVAMVGSNISLPCEAFGDPPPSISWFRGTSLQDSHLGYLPGTSNKYFIPNVTENDAGRYICRAENVAGVTRRIIVLSVLSPPKILNFPKEMSAISGDVVFMSCITRGLPRPTVKWLRDGQIVGGALNSYNNYLRFIANSSHTGNYTCYAENKAGTDSATTHLVILEPPTMSGSPREKMEGLVGGDVRLSCRVSGYPRPVVVWQHKGQTIQKFVDSHDFEYDLELNDLTERDGGMYSCIASNKAGSSRKTVELTILSPPEIIDWDSPVINVIPGDTVTISCSVNGIPRPKVTWLRENRTLTSEFFNNDGILRFISESSHTGNYSCFASNKAGSDSKNVTLNVYTAPSFKLNTFEELEAIKGSTVSLLCSALGDPAPSINWFFNGRLVDGISNVYPSFSKDKLTIMDVEEENEGTYECTATNKAGSNSRRISITVLDSPSVNKWPEELSITEGNEVVLECEVRGKPKPKIVWLKNGMPLSSDLVYRGNRIRFIATSNDSGEYKCSALNKAGEDSTQTALTVKVHPQIDPPHFENVVTLEGDTLSLKCLARGVPKPVVTWSFNGTLVDISKTSITASNNSLSVDQVKEYNSGKYVCSAENDLGSVHKIFEVFVHVIPRIIDDFSEMILLNEGDDFSIPCTSYGVPSPNVFWIKEDKMLKKGLYEEHYVILNDNTLIISDAQSNMKGVYTCLGTNSEGSAMKNYTVDIIVPPKFGSTDHENITLIEVEESYNGVLNCPTDSSDILWLKDGEKVDLTLNERADDVHFQLMDGGKSLKITEAFSTDTGIYSCVSKDGSKSLFQVEVLQRPHFLEDFPQTEHELKEGNSLTLDCSATGNPLPKINWRHMEKNLPITKHTVAGVLVKGDRKDNLHFPSLKSFHSGRYMCLAHNKVGREGRAFTLKVIVPPKLEGPAEEKLSSVVGETLSLECPISGFPNPKFSWKHSKLSGETETLKSSYKSIMINSVNKNDAGSITCNGTNKAGSVTKTFIISVLVPPSIKIPESKEMLAVEGEDLSIECTTHGDPLPSVTWLKDQHLTDHSSAITTITEPAFNKTQVFKLKIHSLRKKDEGKYTCIASNDVGIAEQVYDLSVITPPILSDQTFLYHNKPVNVIVNQNTTLKCPVKENQVYDIEWSVYKNNSKMIIKQEGKELQLIDVSETDEGVYTCSATNKAGKVDASFEVNALVPPTFLPEYLPNQALQINEELIINCSTRSKPEASVVWLKDNVKINKNDSKNFKLVDSNQTLIVSEVKINDSGDYLCIVSNAAGETERAFTVDVLDAPKIDLSGDQSVEEISPQNQTVKLHRRIVLRCPLSGVPPPTINWYKDNILIKPTDDNLVHILSDGRKLFILQVGVESAGTYKCVASNELGVKELNYNLSVIVPLEWSPWSAWSVCSKDCGGGSKTRLRFCGDIKEDYSSGFVTYDSSKCRGESVEHQICNIQPCQVDGNWGEWSTWSECSSTCGESIRNRQRLCNNPSSLYGGLPCSGNATEQEPCDVPLCPIDGEWSSWSEWSDCTVSCRGGLKFRERRCSSPAPSHNGKPCQGLSRDIVECNSHPCPVDGKWTSWGSWSKCTATCGVGNMVRYRHCYKPLYGGKPCDGKNKEVKQCSMKPCPESPKPESLILPSKISGYNDAAEKNLKNVGIEPNIQYATGNVEMIAEGRNGGHSVALDNKKTVNGKTQKAMATIFISRTVNKQDSPGHKTPKNLKKHGNKRDNPTGLWTVSPSQLAADKRKGDKRSKAKLKSCPLGYRYSKSRRKCRDINECNEKSAYCSHFCHNTRGSYKCSCPDGLMLLNNPYQCEKEETDYSYYSSDEGALSDMDVNYQGSNGYDEEFFISLSMKRNNEVACNKGFKKNEFRKCVDINECQNSSFNLCNLEQVCINTAGGYLCLDTPCPDNFELEAERRRCTLNCILNSSACLEGAAKSESVQYESVDLGAGEVSVMQTIIKLKVFDENGLQLNNTAYEIISNDEGIPVSLIEENGEGILYSYDTFKVHKLYRVNVKGISKDTNETILYSVQFVIFLYNSTVWLI